MVSHDCSKHSDVAAGEASLPRGDSKLRILVVEDDCDTADSTVMLLDLLGFQARSACNGTLALQEAQACWPDVVLLDLGLPGMDGFEVAKRLRASTPSHGKRLFIVVVSGYSGDSFCARSKEEGIDLHLAKPVEPAVLEGLLRGLQPTVMPSAERKVSPFERRASCSPTLRHYSDMALLKHCVQAATNIRGRVHEIRYKLRTAPTREEKIQWYGEFHRNTASFLEENEKATALLMSLQTCSLDSRCEGLAPATK
jgi:CheY-like chemotaxis protein